MTCGQSSALEPEEQVLRYFALSQDKDLSGFSGSLKEFLDNFMEGNSQIDDETVNEYRTRFKRSLSICLKVFSEDVFVNPVAEKKKKGLVHYDLVMTTVGELSDGIITNYGDKIKEAYAELCGSEEFKKTLGGGLQDKSRVLKRKAKWSELLEAAINVKS